MYYIKSGLQSNRFLLTVVGVQSWSGYIKSTQPSDIFTDDWPTTSDILGNKSLTRNKTLFRFWHTRNDEKVSVSFRCFQFSAITWKDIPPRTLTIIEAFTYISSVFLCAKMKLHRPSNEMKTYVINKVKWCQACPCMICQAVNHQI